MKKTLTLLIILIIAFLFVWLLQGEQQQKTLPINEVSFASVDEIKKPAPKSNRPSLSPEPVAVTAEPIREQEPEQQDKPLSYLQIYRLYRSLQFCRSFFYYKVDAENRQPLPLETMLRKHLTRYGTEQKIEFSDSQLDYFRRYTEQCESDLELIEKRLELDQVIEMSNIFEAQSELFQLLLTHPAKTDKEKKIKQTLNDRKNWLEAAEAVLYIYEHANNTLSDEQLAQLEADIAELNRLLEEGINNPQLNSRYFQQIQQKRQQLFSQKHIDETLKEQLWNRFNQATLQLHEQLKNKDPDVLFEVAQVANFSHNIRRMMSVQHDEDYLENNFRYYQKTQTAITTKVNINNLLQRESNVHEPAIFKSAADHAWTLYYCHLGGDCDSRSDIITSTCVGYLLNSDYFPKSCNMSVTEFYINHLISPNRLQDVQFFFDFLMKKYGS